MTGERQDVAGVAGHILPLVFREKQVVVPKVGKFHRDRVVLGRWSGTKGEGAGQCV